MKDRALGIASIALTLLLGMPSVAALFGVETFGALEPYAMALLAFSPLATAFLGFCAGWSLRGMKDTRGKAAQGKSPDELAGMFAAMDFGPKFSIFTAYERGYMECDLQTAQKMEEHEIDSVTYFLRKESIGDGRVRWHLTDEARMALEGHPEVLDTMEAWRNADRRRRGYQTAGTDEELTEIITQQAKDWPEDPDWNGVPG